MAALTQAELETSSVPLINLDDAILPGGFASGCLMDYHGHRLLLTVLHATDCGLPLAVQVGWDSTQRRAKLWRLEGLNFLGRVTVTAGNPLTFEAAERIDFAYVDVPDHVQPFLEQTDPHTGNILTSRPCKVWSADAIAEPVEGVPYGFAGHTKPSLEGHPIIAPDVKFCFTELRVWSGLTYVGKSGDYLVFQLPVDHPGDEYFRGCSGAPIIDADGHVVALVNGGDAPRPLIFGIALQRFRFALDIHTGRFP